MSNVKDGPMARLNPYNPGAGRFKKTHVGPDGRRYVAGRWHPVSMDQARYCSTVRQRNGDRYSQKAFTIARNMADAAAIETAEIEARKALVRDASGDSMTLADMRDALQSDAGKLRSIKDEDIFTTPAGAADGWREATETLLEDQKQRAARRGVNFSGLDGSAPKKTKRGVRGGRKRKVVAAKTEGDAPEPSPKEAELAKGEKGATVDPPDGTSIKVSSKAKAKSEKGADKPKGG